MSDWDDFEEGGEIAKKPCEKVNRKVTPVFFLIDTSGSMSGTKIDTVNNTMEEIMRDLSDLDSADFNLKYAVLSFEANCIWETGDNGLIDCDGEWQRLETGSLTYFNTACRMLNEKLSGHGFFKFAAGNTITPPVIILLTDGYANDGNENGLDGIAVLKKNKYFQGSFKVALAIGDDANQQLCSNFTGDKETVWTAYDQRTLKKMMEAIIKASITVSSGGSSDVHGTAENPDKIKADAEKLKTGIESEIAGDSDLMKSANCPANETWDEDK